MADGNWKEVAKSEDIVEGKLTTVELSEEESVILLRRGTKLVALGDACPHVGCPLHFGRLDGDTITCICHNARFDADTGRMTSPPALDDLPSYEVREEDGAVLLGARTDPKLEMPAGSDGRVVAIAGGGAAASMAAEQLRREGFAGRIVMITPEPHRPYDRTLLSKFYLAGGMGFDDIALRPASTYEELGVELWTGKAVTAVDPDEKRLSLDDGSTLEADFIVLATGSKPKSLPIEGADLAGVHLLRKPEDAEAIRDRAPSANNIVVIGASFIGTEVAAYLREAGLKVTIIAPEKVPFASVFGEEIGRKFAQMHTDAGVQLKLGAGVSRLSGSASVEAVELSDGTSVPADLVVVGVGVEPVVDYLEGTGLVENGAVTVDNYLQTSKSGIYALGDIARVRDSDGGKRVEHWVVAQRHGRQVARSIMGTGEPLPYTPFFWTRQFESSFAYFGFAPDYDELKIKGTVAEGKFLAGYFNGGKLAAVGTMGKPKTAIRYGQLLDEGRSITPEDFEAGLKALGG
jgi:NADPH-dependent 2,4-dienoyl-CoA reductase/sulfur reductase-like enzyme/nitrite reductase/ring-hydroxylating ferredoxin subunit